MTQPNTPCDTESATTLPPANSRSTHWAAASPMPSGRRRTRCRAAACRRCSGSASVESRPGRRAHRAAQPCHNAHPRPVSTAATARHTAVTLRKAASPRGRRRRRAASGRASRARPRPSRNGRPTGRRMRAVSHRPASTPATQAHSCQSFFISSTPFDRAARIALAFSGRLC